MKREREMDRKLRHCKGKFLKRDSGGRARRVCGYVAHDQVSSDLTYTLLKISLSKKFAKNIIMDMRKSGVLGKSSNIVCTTCYDHFRGKNFSSNSEGNDSEDVRYSTETDHDTSKGSDSKIWGFLQRPTTQPKFCRQDWPVHAQ